MPQGHTDNPASHRADKQPIAKFPNQQWGENRNGFGPIEQLHHAQHAIRYWRIHLDDGRASTPGSFFVAGGNVNCFSTSRSTTGENSTTAARNGASGLASKTRPTEGISMVTTSASLRGRYGARRQSWSISRPARRRKRWPRNDGVRRLLVIRAQQQQPSYCRFPERATGMSFGVGRDGPARSRIFPLKFISFASGQEAGIGMNLAFLCLQYSSCRQHSANTTKSSIRSPT